MRRRRRITVAAVVAVASLASAGVLSVAARSDGGGDASGGAAAGPATSTTIDAGMTVPTPEGWTAAPVPEVGFGVAIPPGWEATVLSGEVLANLPRATPAVTGFVEAARAAAEAGAVFYAAGEDDEGRVSDLKVRAETGTGVADDAGLRDHARQLTAAAALGEPEIEPVADADRPTVQARFQLEATSDGGETVTTEGTETVVLGPGGLVWSLIVTSERADGHDELAATIADTLTLVDP